MVEAEIKKAQIRLMKEKFTPTLLPELKGITREMKPFQEPINRLYFFGPPGHYEALDDGFAITNGRNYYNRPIAYRQNLIRTGDRPTVLLSCLTGPQGGGKRGSEKEYFPLLGSSKVSHGFNGPSLGKLRAGFVKEDGGGKWLDEFDTITVHFHPGYTEYYCSDSDLGLEVEYSVVPTLEGNGAIFRIKANASKENLSFVWALGCLGWDERKDPLEDGSWEETRVVSGNRVTIEDGCFLLKNSSIPKAVVYAGCDFKGAEYSLGVAESFLPRNVPIEEVIKRAGEDESLALSVCPLKDMPEEGHIVVCWGVDEYDREKAEQILARFENDNSSKEVEDNLKNAWFETYIGRALNPKERFINAIKAPAQSYNESTQFWQERSNAFQITTPDAEINSLFRWTAAAHEYNYQPPGFYSDIQFDVFYCHISASGYGREAIGDHGPMEKMLRFYGNMSYNEDLIPGTEELPHFARYYWTWSSAVGFIPFSTPALFRFGLENQTTYWIDQVYRHYLWTGDEGFVRDLFPIVKKGIEWEIRENDPDDDGLFKGPYEYWFADTHLKGPKACAETALALNALESACEMAKLVGDLETAKRYGKLARRTRKKLFGELWDEEAGVLVCKGPLDIPRRHVESMEVFLPIKFASVDELKSYRMLRFVRENLFVKAHDDLTLQLSNDWWPLIWSNHLVIAGDACQTVLAACKGGSIDHWYPILKGVAASAFFSDIPGMRMTILADGSGGSYPHWVNETDPYLHSLVSGIFGIEPQLNQGRITITPTFPSDWKEASIKIKDIAYEFRMEGNEIRVEIDTALTLEKILRIGVRARVKRVTVNGVERKYRVEQGVNRCYINIRTKRERNSLIVVEIDGPPVEIEHPKIVVAGEVYNLEVKNGDIIGFKDPGGAIVGAEIKDGKCSFTPQKQGNRTFFLEIEQDNVSFFQPVDLEVKKGYEVRSEFDPPDPSRDEADPVRPDTVPKVNWQRNPSFDLKSGTIELDLLNNYLQDKDVSIRTEFAGETFEERIRLPSQGGKRLKYKLSEKSFGRLLPGSNPLRVRVDPEGTVCASEIVKWDILEEHPELIDDFHSRLVLVDLLRYYNASIEDYAYNEFKYDVGWHDPVAYQNVWVHPSLTRTDKENLEKRLLLTGSKIPFRIGTSGIYQNIMLLANWEPYMFPTGCELAVDAKIDHIYLLMMNYSYVTKSHLPNGELIIHYGDGKDELVQLIPPYNLDSYVQHFSLRNEKVRFGQLRDDYVGGETDWYPKIHADVVDFPLDGGRITRSVELRSVCSESILGILGITLVKADGDGGK